MTKYILEYDPQTDAAYIKLSRAHIVESTEINEDVIVDLDQNKHLIGIEILNFSMSKFDIKTLITEDIGNATSIVK
jgi:uncharacterized protein YuzE